MSSILHIKSIEEERNLTQITWTNDFQDTFVVNETEEEVEDVTTTTTEKSKTFIILENDDDDEEEKFILERKNFTNGRPNEFLEIINPPDLSNRSKLPDENRYEEKIVGNVSIVEESSRKLNEEVLNEKKYVTTPKAFVYSPTIPQITTRRNRVDTTTTRYNASEGEDFGLQIFLLKIA